MEFPAVLQSLKVLIFWLANIQSDFTEISHSDGVGGCLHFLHMFFELGRQYVIEGGS